MRNVSHLQHLAQKLADFNRCCTNQYRTTCITHRFDFINNGSILFACSLIYAIVKVVAGNRTVCWNFNNVKFVYIPEFPCFCTCCTRHTGQLVIHTEVVLQGNSCKCLCCSFNLDMFLSFNSLMQSIAPTTPFHDTSCLFVDNLYLTVHDNIFVVFIEHGVGFQQLLQCMNTFTLHTVV